MNTKKTMLSLIVMLGAGVFFAISAYANTWYVRDGGGSPTECTGTTNAVYPGVGTNQACAFASPMTVLGYCTGNESNAPPCQVGGLMQSGDTLYIDGDSDINPGTQAQYEIGYDDTGSGLTPGCSTSYPYFCVMGPVPAGISSSQPTSIIGTGTHKPQLWGTQRTYKVLWADNNYITLQWLEITDHDACAYNDPKQACNYDGPYPFGQWALDGLYIGGNGLVLTDIYEHGVGRYGISTDQMGSAVFTRVWAIGNGFGGINVGNSGTTSVTGTLTFNQPIVEWNGCVEAYPVIGGVDNPLNYSNCFGQASGGYGDGLAFGATGSSPSGNWVLKGPGSISFNTQDGFDILHGNAGFGTTQIDKMRFEGNAGQQMKLSSLNDDVTNSIIIGDCGWWQGAIQSLFGGMQYGDACRAGGSAIVFNVTNSGKYTFFNNTILSNGIAFETSDGPNTGCNASTAVNVKNNIVFGGYSWIDDAALDGGSGGNSQSTYYYNDGNDGNGSGTCGNVIFNEDYNIVYGTSNNNQGCIGSHDKCGIYPGFASTMPMGQPNGPANTFYQGNAATSLVSLSPSSPAINAGVTGLTYWNDGNDYHNVTRENPPSIGGLEAGTCAVNPYGCFFDPDCCSGSCSDLSCSVPKPVVSITNPTNGNTFTAGTNVPVNITAVEKNGAISNISLYDGVGAFLGSSKTSPYTYINTNVLPGTYTYKAVGTDTYGVSTESNPVTVAVTSTPPSLPIASITSPANLSSVPAGSNITITTNASETNGTITNISLYNGAGMLLGSSSASPYSYVDKNVLAGTHTYIAKASDAIGSSVISTPVTITVIPPPLPVVSIISPVSGSNFTPGSYITITATASESNGTGNIGTISKVAFYNGTNLLGTATSSPYSYTWNNVAAGNYSLIAIAYDNNNNQTTSKAVAVTVSGLPVVSLAGNNSLYIAPASIVLTAKASEANGTISKVSFYNGSSLLGTVTNSPYKITWINVPLGIYSLTAIAYDNNNNQASSAAVTMTVHGFPSVVLSSNSNSFTAPANIILTAKASEVNGTIGKVEFYNGSSLLGTVTNSPYRIIWINVSQGTYYLKAKGTDNTGVTSISNTVTVTVK